MTAYAKMCRRRAFTTLELTVVMAIVALLFALALPRFARLRDATAVRGAMGDLAAAFSLARETAIVRRATTAVVIDTGAGVVTVRSSGQSVSRHALQTTYGVAIGANRDSAVYDLTGLGFGVTNLTVTIRRGAIVDTLTMSRLGRTRW